MAPRAIIYCAVLSWLHRTPVHRECQWKWKPTIGAATCHCIGRKETPSLCCHFHCSEVVPPFHPPSPLFFLFFFFMCVCAIAHALRGRSVSLLCTRGRLHHLARSGASMKYVRTEGGSKNWPILWTNSTANMRTKGGGPKIQKSC